MDDGTSLPAPAETLRLERFTPQHLHAVCRLLEDPRVAEAHLGRPWPREHIEAHIRQHWCEQTDARTTHHLAFVQRHQAPCFIGAVSVAHDPARAEPGDRTLSYFVDPAWWGQGLATAMLRQACQKAFGADDVWQLTAWIYRDNMASVRVAEKAGLWFAGLVYPPRTGTIDARAMLRYVLRRPCT
ncbi:MAG: GNAT family N-acetyltransferase [Aquabacterium sp.]